MPEEEGVQLRHRRPRCQQSSNTSINYIPETTNQDDDGKYKTSYEEEEAIGADRQTRIRDRGEWHNMHED